LLWVALGPAVRFLLTLAMFAVIVVGLVAMLTGCPDSARQIQVQAANSLATAANTALPMLVERYRQEGLQVVAAAKTREEAEVGVAQVKLKWAPVWKAWGALALAEGLWADALEKDIDTSTVILELKTAYCALLKVFPEDIPALPLVLLTCE
jgi:hypothetical protein